MNWLTYFSKQVDIDFPIDSLKFVDWFRITLNFAEYLLMIPIFVAEVISHG